MKKLVCIVALSFACFASQSALYADIFLSLDSASATFVQGSGIRDVRILGRSNAVDQLIGLTADFKGNGGAIFNFVSATQFNQDNIDQDPMSPTFGLLVTSGPFYTKFFSESGFVGFNNINRAGGSSIAIGVGDNTVASMSLEYNNPQTFPAVATPLGKLRVDITGLAPGNYPINFTDAVANGAASQIPSPSTNGFFTITAIPEPTSFALVVGAMLVGISARRRREIAA